MITDAEIEELRDIIAWLWKDYPRDYPAWVKACDRFKEHRENRRQFEKFKAFCKERAKWAQKRNRGT